MKVVHKELQKEAISGRIANGDGVDDEGHHQAGFP